jgi:hypothetical protein
VTAGTVTLDVMPVPNFILQFHTFFFSSKLYSFPTTVVDEEKRLELRLRLLSSK